MKKPFSLRALGGICFFAPALSAFLLLVPSALAQTVARPGYQLVDSAPVALGGAVSSLTDGSYVTFDGQSVDLWDAAGLHQLNLGSFPTLLFVSFIEVHPSQTFAVLGESSNGEIYSVNLDGSGMTLLTQAAFNYAFCFDPDGSRGWLSAALGGWGAGNDLLEIDLASGQMTQRAHVAGPSGPLTTDNAGNLYYGTQFDGWPVPPDTQNLIRFDVADLQSSGTLTELDATVLIDQLDGTSGIAINMTGPGVLFVVESDPTGAAENILRRYDLAGNLRDEVLAATASINGLELVASASTAILAPYQPQGTELRMCSTDYNFGVSERLTLGSKRCGIAFDGPTSANAGPAVVTVRDVPIGGSASIMLTRTAFLQFPEFEMDLGWGVPVFLMTEPALILRRTMAFDADSVGEVQLAYQQPDYMFSVVAFQAVIRDATGSPVGTSEIVVNN